MDQNYYKTGALEMAAAYVEIVPDLTIDGSERLRQSTKRMADNIQRMEGEDTKIERLEAEVSRARLERDKAIARLEEDAARARRESGGEMARMREEIAGLKRQRNPPVYEMLDTLKDSSETDGVSGEFLKSLTGMINKLGKSQAAAIREIRTGYDAKIEEMRREMGLMSVEGNLKRGPPAGSGEEGAADGKGDADDLDMRDP